AVNLGVHSGAVTIVVTANTTETATAALNANGVNNASYTSVVVKPASGTNPKVSGNIPNNSIIRLNGASHVMIDGSNNGTLSRNLTLMNTSPLTSFVVAIGSVNFPVMGDTVKNCSIIN